MVSSSSRYLGIICLIIMSTPLQAKESMVWHVLHLPPLMILTGDDAGKGIGDAFLRHYQKEMPQYTHETIELNWKRVWSDIKAGKQVCNSMALKTPAREEFALFSETTSIALPTRIIMRASTHDQLGQPETLALTDFLNHPEVTGEFQSTRSYSSEIDAIIDNRAPGSNIKERTTSGANLLKMLLYERFDYMIEYPYIAEYFSRAIPQASERIRSVAIEEIAPFIYVNVACPKTDWGAERIAALNAVLKRTQHSDEYLNMVMMWYGNEQERKALREGYQKMIDSE